MFNIKLMYILAQKYLVYRLWAAFIMDVGEEIFWKIDKNWQYWEWYLYVHKTKFNYCIMMGGGLTLKNK